jgi:hypothetical protein
MLTSNRYAFNSTVVLRVILIEQKPGHFAPALVLQDNRRKF